MTNSRPNGSGDMNVIRNGHPPKLALGPRDAAKAIGISERTLWQLTHDGCIAYVKINNRTVYRVSSLEAYLAAHEKR